MAGKKTPSFDGTGWGGRDEVKLVYSMLTARFHVRCPSCGPCSSRGPGRSTLRGVRSWMKGDAEGCARRVQCARRTLDSVSGFIQKSKRSGDTRLSISLKFAFFLHSFCSHRLSCLGLIFTISYAAILFYFSSTPFMTNCSFTH
jgi:hypothetical protein